MTIPDRRRWWFAALLLLCLSCATRLLAQGPPFLTDDPVPVDLHHYEAYLFGGVSAGRTEVDPTGPAFEFNWGALPRVQLHSVLPLVAIVPRNPYGPDDPRHFGLGDVELGAKLAWVLQTRHRPQIGSFTMLELPTASYKDGLGVGRVWYKLPLWAYKDVGQWTFDGGGGYQLVHQTGFSSFPYGAFLAERKLGKPLELGVEVFSHGGEGAGTPHARSSTLIDGGGYYHFRKPGWQFLFAYGHSVAGQSETYSYVALYYTWGKDKAQDDTSGPAPIPGAPGLQ